MLSSSFRKQATKVLLGDNDPRKLASVYDVQPHLSTLDQVANLLDTVTTEAAGI